MLRRFWLAAFLVLACQPTPIPSRVMTRAPETDRPAGTQASGVPSPQSGSTPEVEGPVPSASAPSSSGAVRSLEAAKAWALDRLGSTQYACLDAIVSRESRWNPEARNAKSGAYGWFQVYPASKLRDRSPMGQMRWGIAYAERRYGSFCQAWAFWRGHGWY